jgi:hypothetical protein
MPLYKFAYEYIIDHEFTDNKITFTKIFVIQSTRQCNYDKENHILIFLCCFHTRIYCGNYITELRNSKLHNVFVKLGHNKISEYNRLDFIKMESYLRKQSPLMLHVKNAFPTYMYIFNAYSLTRIHKFSFLSLQRNLT